jgi:hypothetical protein
LNGRFPTSSDEFDPAGGFDDQKRVELEQTRVTEDDGVAHIEYRVVR